MTVDTLTEHDGLREIEDSNEDIPREMLAVLGANLLHYYRVSRTGSPHAWVRPSPRPPEPQPGSSPSGPSVQTQRRRAAAALGVSLFFALAVHLGTGSSRAAMPASPYALASRDAYTSLVAQAQVPRLPVFAQPSGTAEPTSVLDHPTRGGQPLVFLIADDSRDDWLRVQLPVRPNGSMGWVRRDDVKISATRYRVQVALGRHRLEVYDGPELVFHAPVAIGTRDTPTPGGRFFLKELVEPPTDDSIYGNYVFGLSGFSEVVESFNGGDGVIGIHGTNDPASIGRVRVPPSISTATPTRWERSRGRAR